MADLILLSEWQKSQYEFWAPVKGFPHYEVSNFGRIRTYMRHGSRFGGVNEQPTVRNTQPNKQGYIQLTLNRDRRPCQFRLHRLVAEAFVPNPEDLPLVNHINCIRGDTRSENLEWTTYEGNQQHASRCGTLAKGESHPNSKLTDDIVRDIRRWFAAGDSRRKIAQRLGVTPYTVSRVIERKHWRHVE